MNTKAHARLSAMKQRVEDLHMEVTNGLISYAYEDSYDGRCSSRHLLECQRHIDDVCKRTLTDAWVQSHQAANLPVLDRSEEKL